MSLLDTASLLLTPNAYKEGKLYSVIPSDGSGDFTFTRATTATRVNSDGLVELVPYNLVSYSEQFDNAAWTKLNGTITPNTIASPSDISNADTFTDNSTNAAHSIVRFSQWSTTQQTFSIYVKPNTLTKFYIANGSLGSAVFFDLTTETIEGTITASSSPMINNTITPMANGWYRLSTTHTATASQTLQLGFYKVFNASSLGATATYIGTGETAYLWGAQLVEGSNALPYQKTETRLNIPRLDYSNGTCPSILLEPQRTNLALQSSSFDNVYWGKGNVSVSANTTTAPDGTLTADKIIENTSNSNHEINHSNVPLSATSYSYSVYAKADGRNWIALSIQSQYTFFDLQNGVVGSSAVGNVNDIKSVGNGWYRCTITRTAAAANNFGLIRLALDDNTPTYTGDGTSGIYLWGAQLEVGAYATSYIPTTSATVTRNYDIPSLSNVYTNGFISASGGTWFTHLVNNVPRTRDSGGGVGLRLSNIAGNNVFHISTPSGSNQRYWIRKIVGGVNTDLYNTITNEIKVAIKWNGTTADVFVNGVEVVSATAFTSVDLENLNVNNPNIPYSINAMTLFPTSLTDAECIALTTI